MREQKEPWRCPVCGWTAPEDRKNESWDHCPNCLAGIHEEEMEDGICGGILEPVSVWIREDDSWQIIGRCRLCGGMEEMSMTAWDNRMKILSIAARPLSQPPFPIERVQELTKLMGGRGEIGGNSDEQRK